MVILNNPLPLGVRYWYMKQSVEIGWSSNVLKMQIESNLYDRQIKSNKINNFTATLPVPQSDLANYLLWRGQHRLSACQAYWDVHEE